MGCGIPGEGNRKRYTDEEIIKIFDMTKGNVSRSARVMGYNPAYLRKRIRESDELKIGLTEARETLFDNLEDKLQEHIDSGNFPALKYRMDAQCKQKGYGTTGLNIDLNANVKHGMDDDLAAEMLRKFKEGLE